MLCILTRSGYVRSDAPSWASWIAQVSQTHGQFYAPIGRSALRCVRSLMAEDSPPAVAGSTLPPVVAPDTTVIVCTLFTAVVGSDIAEAVGAACVQLKWAPDLPTQAWPPFGQPHFPPRSAIVNTFRHYTKLFQGVRASSAAGVWDTGARFRAELGLSALPSGKVLGRLERLGELPTIYSIGGDKLLPRPVDWPAHVASVGFFFAEEANLAQPPTLAPQRSKHKMEMDAQLPAHPATVPVDGTDAFGGERLQTLRAWVAKQRRADRVIVAVNFGSMATCHQISCNAVTAARDLGHACVFVRGWGQGLSNTDSAGTKERKAKQQQQRQGEEAAEGVCGTACSDDHDLFEIDSAPHEWLFGAVSVVIHHGGAGTTARALWCGTPSVICPILRFYDQPGWAQTLATQQLGVVRVGGHSARSSSPACLCRLDTMRVELIGHFKPCMTVIYLHI